MTNNGETDQAGVRINVNVDSAGIIFKQLGRTVTVHAGMTESFEFSTTYVVPNINDSNEYYTVTAYLNAIENDNTTDDDTLSVNACVVYNPGFGITDNQQNIWFVGQNQPNPATSTSIIPYNIPIADEVTLKILSINGQILYQEILQAVSGKNEIVINTDFLANGIYYYSMEYQGKTIVKKMSVQK